MVSDRERPQIACGYHGGINSRDGTKGRPSADRVARWGAGAIADAGWERTGGSCFRIAVCRGKISPSAPPYLPPSVARATFVLAGVPPHESTCDARIYRNQAPRSHRTIDAVRSRGLLCSMDLSNQGGPAHELTAMGNVLES